MTPRAGHPTFDDCRTAHRLLYWLFGLFGTLLVGYLAAVGYTLDKAAAATTTAQAVQASANVAQAAQGERDKHIASQLEQIASDLRKLRDELQAHERAQRGSN